MEWSLYRHTYQFYEQSATCKLTWWNKPLSHGRAIGFVWFYIESRWANHQIHILLKLFPCKYLFFWLFCCWKLICLCKNLLFHFYFHLLIQYHYCDHRLAHQRTGERIIKSLSCSNYFVANTLFLFILMLKTYLFVQKHTLSFFDELVDPMSSVWLQTRTSDQLDVQVSDPQLSW